MEQKTYKMQIAYEGTHYSGWQVQPNGVTIQALIQEALKTILRQEVEVIGSGRTDAGVHALGQVAHFRTTASFDCGRVFASLNALLPPDIRILTLVETNKDFHARFDALSKCYYYHLSLGPIQPPLDRFYRWHIKQPFNLSAVKEAAALLIGEHDFTSVANEPTKGSVTRDPVRTLSRLAIIEEDKGIRFEFEANGFLYKMVRNLMGLLHEVGIGKRRPEEVKAILAAKDRRKAGQAAPPHGLFLAYVKYPECH